MRGSRFLGHAAPAASEEEARDWLAAEQRRYFDATHHCSAWRLRDGRWRANDAGEPSGSAGVPILAAIDGAGVVDCVVVVTRYFGGTRLGVGGLARAYGEAAAEALRAAPRRTGVPAVRLRVRYAYRHTAAVMRVLEAHETHDVAHGFVPGGQQAEVCFSVARDAESGVRAFLRDATGGAVSSEIVAQPVIYRTPPA